ncbi:MAG TPA: Uma2 family endonuclease [Chthonomonadaceae bacterium]|nr:Uma2 family endonuclease [Chthonomonadaceae bacterium]
MPQTQEPAPNRVRWTRAQCDAIVAAGVLTGRYELIDGEVIYKKGEKPQHCVTVVLLHAWLTAVFGALFVQSQATIDVGDADPDHNEPEPDAAVTAKPTTAYADRHPGPADLVLVVEVSDTTLRFDRTTKAALYARADIVEYWIVDIVGRQVFVHRQPSAEGYAEITAYGPDERIATLARPNDAVRVADLLPPIA